MRNKNKRWFLLLLVAIIGHCLAENRTQELQEKLLRNVFSPRMDYEQWKPLGRGDPLKNDPTYDYVPPVLDRVHYWVDPVRKPDAASDGQNQKTEILLLGVSSKKPSTGTSVADRKDTFDPFMKFVEGPKFSGNQRVGKPTFQFPPYFPQFLQNNNKNKYEKNSYPKGNMPLTILMPPPMVTKPSIPHLNNPVQRPIPLKISTMVPISAVSVSTEPSTAEAPQVTILSSNLVYHSSSLADGLVDWKQPTEGRITTANPLIKNGFRDEIVYSSNLHPPDVFGKVAFNSNNFSNIIASDSNHNINYVTPPPLAQSEGILFKGHVSDDSLDISNTYVKIGKTEAQVEDQMYPVMAEMQPLTMQTLEQMQTLQPPPMLTSPVFNEVTNPVLVLLKKEKNRLNTTPYVTKLPSVVVTTTSTTTTTEAPETTTSTSTTTSLTTDPIFKHYKQPMEPLKGPLYLIIQGHSKVKTYGPAKQMNGISVQETNEIDDRDLKTDYSIKHLHVYKKEMEESPRRGRTSDLQTLKHVIQTGLGSLDLTDLNVDRKDDFRNTEIKASFEVSDNEGITEKYHKGIVEEARKL